MQRLYSVGCQALVENGEPPPWFDCGFARGSGATNGNGRWPTTAHGENLFACPLPCSSREIVGLESFHQRRRILCELTHCWRRKNKFPVGDVMFR